MHLGHPYGFPRRGSQRWAGPTLKRVCQRLSAWVFVLLGIAGLRGSEPLTSIQQLQSRQVDSTSAPVPVSLVLQSLYMDPDWHFAWMSDGTGLIFVNSQSLPMLMSPGSRARIDVPTLPGLNEMDWSKARLTPLPTQALPPARAIPGIPPSVLLTNQIWAEFSGIVRQREFADAHIGAEILVNGELGELFVFEGSQELDIPTNATVQATGVLLKADAHSKPGMRFKAFVPSTTSIQVVHRDLAPYFTNRILEPVQIAAAPTSTPVTVRGRVLSPVSKDKIPIRAGAVDLDVLPLLHPDVLPGDEIEALGNLIQGNGGRLSLQSALHRQVAPIGNPTNTVYAPVIRSIGAIRALSKESADRELPVSISALVTGNYTGKAQGPLFLQDDTGGIYAYHGTNVLPQPLTVGESVLVDGYTSSGRFAPEILVGNIRSTHSHRKPRATRLEIGVLKSGLHDSQWVEFAGQVARVWMQDKRPRLEVSDGVESVEVNLGSEVPPFHLAESMVRLRGVAATHYNERRQAYGAYVWCPSDAFITVEEGPDQVAFETPPQTIASLSSFQKRSLSPSRAHIRGIVTADGLNGRVIVQSDRDAIEVHASPSFSIPPGTEVDVVGLMHWAGNRLDLRRAMIRPLGTVPLPVPIPPHVLTNSEPELDALRSVVEGEVLSMHSDRTALNLLLMQEVPIQVRVPLATNRLYRADVTAGARVRVTGAQIGRYSSDGLLTSCEVLAAGHEDLVVLEPAPWWTRRHTLATLFSTAMVALGAYGWMASLRSKVHKQALEIEARFQQQTELERRNAELVERAGEILLEIDQEGKITGANPSAIRFFGRQREQLLGTRLMQLAALDDRARVHRAVNTVALGSTSERLEFQHLDSEQRIRWIEIQIQAIPMVGSPRHLGAVGREITDRKRAEEALRQSEQNLRRIIEFLPDGVLLVDSGAIVRFQNSRASSLLGHGSGNHVGQPLASLRNRSLDLWVSALLESSDQSPEGFRSGAMQTMTLTREDGTEFLADMSAGVITRERSRSCLVCFRDAAARLAAEEMLRDQAVMARAETAIARVIGLARDEEAMLLECVTLLVDRMDAAVVRFWRTSVEGLPARLIATASDASFTDDPAILGGPVAEHLALPEPWPASIRLDDLVNDPSMAAASSRGLRTCCIHTVLTGDVATGVMEVYFRRPVSSKIAGVLGSIATSLSSGLVRVDAIAQMDRSNFKLRAVLNSAPVAIVEVSNPGTVENFNPAAAALFGWNREAALGTDFASLAGLTKELAEALARVADGGEPVSGFETRMQRAGGTGFACSLFAAPASGPNQAGIGIVCVIVDLSERNRIEEESERIQRRLRDAQRLESLGVMAGGIAHDFNNLLTSILGNASLAGLSLQPGTDLHGHFQEIERGARRAGDLCRLMLAYAGQAGIERQAADLSELVRDTLRLVQHGISKLAEIHLDLGTNLPALMVDSAQIRQVVMNLVANASDALCDRSGQIRIRTEWRIDDGDTSLPRMDLPPGPHVLLEVSDNGCGMEESVVNRIFDPFFTTKFSGRGLGLAAVWGVVRGHGGAIAVHSSPGKGSTFRVWLPAPNSVPTQPIPARASPVETARLPMGTVILIDDESPLRKVARQILNRFGTETLEAVDGIEGLELVLRNRERHPAVLLDLTMPRMGGREVLARLRRDAPEIPVILMSGYVAGSEPQASSGPEADGFLSKPFTASQLIQVLSEAWTRRKGRTGKNG